MKTTITAAVVMLAALIPTGVVHAATIVYQQGQTNAFVSGYSGVDDANIISGSPNSNYGQYGAKINPSGTKGLLRFNLASFAGRFARINSVALTFDASIMTGSVVNGTVLAYAILPANSGWGEGAVYGSSQTGSCCWNYAKYNTQAWAGSVGLSTPGVDYDSVLLGSFNYNSANTYSMTFARNSAQLKALVNSWTNATNPGILLVEGNPLRDGYLYFYESDPGNTRGPKLTIDYTTGPAIIVEQPAGNALTNSSGVNCGSSSPGTAAAAKTFTLRNDGSTTLSNIAVNATGGNSADFVVSGLGATSLAPGASTTVTVAFTPGAAGARSTTLAFASNDADYNPFNVALSGSGWNAIEIWRNQYFGTTTNSGNAADTADPDGDGLKNLAEFAFGSSPTNANSRVLLTGSVQSGSFVSSFIQPTNVSGIAYGAEVSTNLQSNSWTPVADSGSGSNHVFSVPVSAGSQQFLRWKIINP